jgi:enoyl-CoA hydratase/carnithine racemase
MFLCWPTHGQDSALHVTQEQRDRYMSLAFESVMAIHRLPMPTIAAISGTGSE